ncbi:hypothetical protein HPP92_013200 [Vanilla planifolia]|uniref:Uncharacterized protein n=1 Tax=Vanilla planifolia TaxID=51239 RepID=A0A835V0E1_VANPL|nr:hypothetical protein HPP92_013655 [Vanilla planifolia]KAG0478481.1 hypothetical protein HPP92_013200 [Vanilla planifolia]
MKKSKLLIKVEKLHHHHLLHHHHQMKMALKNRAAQAQISTANKGSIKRLKSRHSALARTWNDPNAGHVVREKGPFVCNPSAAGRSSRLQRRTRACPGPAGAVHARSWIL